MTCMSTDRKPSEEKNEYIYTDIHQLSSPPFPGDGEKGVHQSLPEAQKDSANVFRTTSRYD